MYTLVIYLYAAAIKLAALFGHRKAKQMIEGHKEIFPSLKEKIQEGTSYVWFHASSLGEFEQGRPMIEKLRAEHPEYRVVLTFFSPSGYRSARNYQQADVVCYLPFDTPCNVKRFLSIVQPKMVFFIKYEYWLNYLSALKKRAVPTYIISAIFRREQVFFRFWGGFYRKALRCFTHLFVQNEESRELLAGIGVANVTVAGDTRFDRVAKISEQARQLPLVEAFVEDGKRIFIAGSSWGADEAVYMPFFNANPGWKLIIASHEVTEDRIKAIEQQVQGYCVRYTQATIEEVRSAKCLIIDCFGLLSSIYRYGNVAYVGGGFGVGIHNVLEAAVFGIPVFFGPNNRKFQEAQCLKACGGGIEITSAADFEKRMKAFDNDAVEVKRVGDAAGYYVSHNSGASVKIFAALGL